MNAKSLRALPVLIALVTSLGCCIEIKSCQPIVVSISEIGACRGYDEVTWTPVDTTDTFSVNDERIYFYLESNVEVSLAIVGITKTSCGLSIELVAKEGDTISVGSVRRKENNSRPAIIALR